MKSFTVQCCAVLAVVVSVVMGRAVTKKHNSIHYWEQVQHEAQNLLKQNLIDVEVYYLRNPSTCVKELPCLARESLKPIQMNLTDALYRTLYQCDINMTLNCTVNKYPLVNLKVLLKNIIDCNGTLCPPRT